MKFIILLHFIAAFSSNSGQAQELGIGKFRNDSDCELSAVARHDFFEPNSENSYQSIIYLYDHFHWDKNKLEKVVSKACGLDMDKYLHALKENKAWAVKGERNKIT